MVEWLAGNRIRGTSTERTTGAGFNPVNAVSGGWKELARVTSNDTDVTSIPDKRYYMILSDHGWNTANAGIGMQINGDTTGGHYPRRYSQNGGSEATPTSETNIFTDTMGGGTQTGKRWFMVQHIANKSNKEKLIQYDMVFNRSGLGEGNAPDRIEGVAKWTDTSESIDRLDLRNFNSGTITSDSQVVVLGWDPDDTHTDNFWEQLASTDWSSGSGIDTGTFTAKKYLWVQGWYKTGSMSGSYSALQVGNDTIDTGSNYAERYSMGGSGYVESANASNLFAPVGQGNDPSNVHTFFNLFIINNASSEKLIISRAGGFDTAGVTQHPNRSEAVSKWDNTSAQINRLKVSSQAGSGNYTAGNITVWGSD